MPETKESIYAEQLKKRGFAKMPDIAASRAEKAKGGPSFSAFGVVTFATDETGQSWAAAGIHDLSGLKFKNTSTSVREMAEGLGISKKPN